MVPWDLIISCGRVVRIRGLALAALALLSLRGTIEAQSPQWIWHAATNPPAAGAQVVYFRKSFRTPPLLWNARLALSADDRAEVFLNGVAIAQCEQWDQPVRAEVSVRLNQGENVIAVRAENRAGAAGVLVDLGLGGQTNLVSDNSWLVSTNQEPGWSGLSFNAAHWQPASALGPHGMLPWKSVLSRPRATPAETLAVPPGFKVELLRSAEPEEGSWICLAFDERGRLTISPEGDKSPLWRLSFSQGQIAGLEAVPAPVRFAMGLLYANNSLYANARGPEGAGLYRLVDANHNDKFDPEEMRLLKAFAGGSEHGYHAVRLGTDGKIYVINGNGTKLPQGLAPRAFFRHYGQDVLSRNPDETTEASAADAVQCHVLRTDPEGKVWELWAGGMRNAYAFDVSPDGELFAFDSDMEWDWGTPWYRPTRMVHLIAGGDYGWRDGTRTWPDYYEDSLPSMLDVGIGSPTGVRFGTKSNFPSDLRRALFVMDWSYGRILAVHLQPNGASYRATFEPFLRGTALNLTDLEFGPDGALYFITGGRGTQSGLYRVSYVPEAGSKSPDATTDPGPSSAVAAAPSRTAAAAGDAPTLHSGTDSDQARASRHQLELLSAMDPRAVDILWPHLGGSDRTLRFAARVALESQDISLWQDRALAERQPVAAFGALLALARVGETHRQGELLAALDRFPLVSLSEPEKLMKLRVLEVSLVRQGRPSSEATQRLIRELDLEYPAPSWPLNRELCRLLLYLDAPTAVSKTLTLLSRAPTQEQQFHYVAQLRNVPTGWSLPERRTFLGWWLKPRDSLRRPPELLRWFEDVGRRYVDGAYVDKYLREFRADAIASLPAEQRQSLAAIIEAPWKKALLVPSTARQFVKEWTMPDLLPELDGSVTGRNFERGRQAFAEAQCMACHRFGNDGGAVGPELTGAGSKYDRRSLLESLLEPSKVVSEQYQNVTAYLKNGDSMVGRLVRQNDEQIVLETDPLSGARETIARAELERMTPSTLSPMPEGLANTLTGDEILDLIAYVQSGGRADAPVFQKAN